MTSGLTIEEAALIQPGYGPTVQPIPSEAAEVLDETQAFVFEDLRFSNFKMFPAEEGVDVPRVNIRASHKFCGWLSCTEVVQYDPEAFGPPVVMQPSPEVVDLPVGGVLDTTSPVADEYSRVVIQFDVEVTSPNLRISARPVADTLLTLNPLHPHQLRLFANGARDRLWVDYLNVEFPKIKGPIWGPLEPVQPISLTQSNDFQFTDRMTIVTEMLFRNGQPHQAQYINFNLVAVPEPATAAFAVLAIGMIGATRLRTTRR